MANTTLRRTVILGSPGDNNDGREWPFVAYLRALARQPETARRAWEKTAKARGLAAARAGRIQDAIRLLEHARTVTPWHDEEIDANLVELRTIRRLQKKLELRPNDPVALLTLGKAYFAQERGDDALECFRRAARVSPRFAEAHAMMGLELHFRGAHSEAEAAYRDALRVQPGHRLAETYLRDLLRGEPPGGAPPDDASDAAGTTGATGASVAATQNTRQSIAAAS